jgi:hypothetical protein
MCDNQLKEVILPGEPGRDQMLLNLTLECKSMPDDPIFGVISVRAEAGEKATLLLPKQLLPKYPKLLRRTPMLQW